MRKSRERGAHKEQKIIIRLAPEEGAPTGLPRDQQGHRGAAGEPEKGTKERLHMPGGWGRVL